jgi:Tol biopolymer transport system component/DNA-binding winged helix-turn-helix (wHTH) protein
MATDAAHKTYRFEDIEIDSEGFRVTRAGEPVRLEPKAVELLLFLASQPGRLVTKAEIQEAVWRDTAVTENALTRLVAQIRKGLGDDAREARYIETVPTRGYRFVAGEAGAAAPVAPAQPAAAPADPARPDRMRILALGAAALALVIAAVAFVFRTEPRGAAGAPAPGATPRELQVSTSDGLNVFPAFSPDGSALAFATLRKGSMEIVLRALAAGAREVEITSDGQQNVQPAFSPDGRLLAYHSVVRGGIFIVPALGGAPRRLTTFGSAPAWSPDGTRIVFQGQAWTGSTEGAFAAGEGSTLWIVPAEGGEPRAITAVAQTGPGGHGSPTWSPSGKLIAFVAGGRVWVVRPDGTGLRRVAEGPRIGGIAPWIIDVAWERDGKTQVWGGVQRFNWSVWRVWVDPETGAAGDELKVVASGADRTAVRRQLTVSPDGSRMAYVTFQTDFEIAEQPLTAAGLPAGEPAPAVRGIAGRKQPPMYSPDGRWLAFAVIRPGEGLALWLTDRASGETRLLVERFEINYASRAWFPDSRRLGFVMREPGGSAFWSVDVQTGETVRLRALPRHMFNVALSLDGTRLAAHGPNEGVLNVWTAPLEGGEPRALTSDREGMGWPVWSRDSRSLAVEVMRGGNTRVGLMPAAGGPVRELTSTPGQSWPCAFSPDGQKIAFAGQRDGIWNIYRVPVDGGPEQRVTSYASPASYVRYCDWSPDGDRIAYEFAESASTVWVTDLPPAP